MERDNTSRPYCPHRSANDVHGVSLMAQNVSTNHGVERRASWQCIVRRDSEFDLQIPSPVRADPRHFDRTRFAVDRNHAADQIDAGVRNVTCAS
jgi:hypothetical protein